MKNLKEKNFLLEMLKKIPIAIYACEKTGIARSTYYRWKKDDAKFSKLADEAIMEGVMLVNDIAENQLLSAIKNGNMSAITFWLRSHHASYTDKIQLSGKVETSTKLTPEQKLLIKKAFALADYNNQNHDQENKDKN
jgi:ACT domain-containing protein